MPRGRPVSKDHTYTPDTPLPSMPCYLYPQHDVIKNFFSLVVVAHKSPQVTNPTNILPVVHLTGCTLCAGLGVRHSRGGGEERGLLHGTRQQTAHAATRELDRRTGKTETEPGQTWGLGKKWNRENLTEFPRATNSIYIVPRIQECV